MDKRLPNQEEIQKHIIATDKITQHTIVHNNNHILIIEDLRE